MFLLISMSVISVVAGAHPPVAACESCELSGPVRSLARGHLLASVQADQGSGSSAHPNPPASLKLRAVELEEQIEDLNLRIRAIDPNVPGGLIVRAYGGYLMTILGLGAGATGITFLALGTAPLVVFLALAVGGVGLAVFGIVFALNAYAEGRTTQQARKEERQRLIEERTQLERKLRRVREGLPETSGLQRPQAWVTLFTF